MVKAAAVGRNGSTKPGRENVKTRRNGQARKLAETTAKFTRTTFSTHRDQDFSDEKELSAQTGHSRQEWGFVFIKEGGDNSLDACDEAGIHPVIEITAGPTGISIRDNGPGIPEPTLAAAVGLECRVSSREAYVAPDRGAQGNAYMTFPAMARVLDPEHGRFIVRTHGKQHTISCGSDPITQRAVIRDDVTDLPKSKKQRSGDGASKLNRGTEIRLEWPLNEPISGFYVWPFGGEDRMPLHPPDDDDGPTFADRFRAVIECFAAFNPQATFILNWFGEKTTWNATNHLWQKWNASRPTSPHWYLQPHIERLIGANIAHGHSTGEDRLVSDFLSEFDGLTGSRKRAEVLDETGLRRARMSELVVDGQLDHAKIETLLASAKKHTRPVNPKRLGVIGEDHLRERLLDMGCVPQSFEYVRKTSKDGPYVLEAGFGWLGDDAENIRKLLLGVNWSATIRNPFRSFPSASDGLDALLSKQYVDELAPVVFFLHLAHPRISYTDRGKSSIVVDASFEKDVISATKAVTKKWAKRRKQEERGRSSRGSRGNMYNRVTFTKAAPAILPAAYAHASGGGRFTVDKRQMYYAAREAFLEQTGSEIGADYFSQTILVQYMNRYPDVTADWKITADPRGALNIPNSGQPVRIPCGTRHIDLYLSTEGPTR